MPLSSAMPARVVRRNRGFPEVPIPFLRPYRSMTKPCKKPRPCVHADLHGHQCAILRGIQGQMTVGNAAEGGQRAIWPTRTALDPVRARPQVAIQPVERIQEPILHIFAAISRACKVGLTRAITEKRRFLVFIRVYADRAAASIIGSPSLSVKSGFP